MIDLFIYGGMLMKLIYNQCWITKYYVISKSQVISTGRRLPVPYFSTNNFLSVRASTSSTLMTISSIACEDWGEKLNWIYFQKNDKRCEIVKLPFHKSHWLPFSRKRTTWFVFSQILPCLLLASQVPKSN